MATRKITLSLDADALAAGADVAEHEGKSLSALVSEALRGVVRERGAQAAGEVYRSPELLDALRGASHRRAEQLAEAA